MALKRPCQSLLLSQGAGKRSKRERERGLLGRAKEGPARNAVCAWLGALTGEPGSSETWATGGLGGAGVQFEMVALDLLGEVLSSKVLELGGRVFPPLLLRALMGRTGGECLNEEDVAALALAASGCTHDHFAGADVAELFVGTWVCPLVRASMTIGAVRLRCMKTSTGVAATDVSVLVLDKSAAATEWARAAAYAMEHVARCAGVSVAEHTGRRSVVCKENQIQDYFSDHESRTPDKDVAAARCALAILVNACLYLCNDGDEVSIDGLFGFAGRNVGAAADMTKSFVAGNAGAAVAGVGLADLSEFDEWFDGVAKAKKSSKARLFSLFLSEKVRTSFECTLKMSAPVEEGAAGSFDSFAAIIARTSERCAEYKLTRTAWRAPLSTRFVVYTVVLVDSNTARVGIGFLDEKTAAAKIKRKASKASITQMNVYCVGSKLLCLGSEFGCNPALTLPTNRSCGNALEVSFYPAYCFDAPNNQAFDGGYIHSCIGKQLAELRKAKLYGVAFGTVASARTALSSPTFSLDQARLLRVLRLEKQLDLASRLLNIAVRVFPWDVEKRAQGALREFNATGSGWALYAKQVESSRWCFMCMRRDRTLPVVAVDAAASPPLADCAELWTTPVECSYDDANVSTVTFLWALGSILSGRTATLGRGDLLERLAPNALTERSHSDWAQTPAALLLDLFKRTESVTNASREYVRKSTHSAIWPESDLFSEWPFKHATDMLARELSEVVVGVYFQRHDRMYRGVVGWAATPNGDRRCDSLFVTKTGTRACCFEITFDPNSKSPDAYLSVSFEAGTGNRFVSVAFGSHVQPSAAKRFKFSQRAIFSSSTAEENWFDVPDDMCVCTEKIEADEFHPDQKNVPVDLLDAFIYTGAPTSHWPDDCGSLIPAALPRYMFAVPEDSARPRALRVTLQHTDEGGNTKKFNAVAFDPTVIAYL